MANIAQNRFCGDDFDETGFLSAFYVPFFGKINLVKFDNFFDHISYQNHWELPYGRYKGNLCLMDEYMVFLCRL